MQKKGMKWSSLLLLIVVVAMITAGCSSNSGDNSSNQSSGGTGKKTEILFWSPFSGSDGPYMKKIVDKYNSSQDQYKVNFVIHPNGEYYKQVDIALSSAKDKPSLMIMHVDKVPTYASKNQLQAVDELAAEAGISKADFAVAPVEYATIDENWYTIPLDIHPLVMYYNKDLFEQAGVTTVPTNRAEFDEAIVKLTDASKGVYGYVVPTLWPQQFIFPTLVWQNGGQLWDGNDVGFNSPEVVEIVQYLRDMIEAGTSPANVQQDGENTLFLQGKNAIQFNGPWMKSQFDEAGINYGVTTVPQLGKAEQAVYAGSHGFVVPQGITDEKIVAGVGDFLKYVTSNSMDWAESGQALASIPMIESDEFKALEFQSTIASSFEYVKFSPNVINWDTISEPIWAELNNALLGNKSVQEAMDDAVNKSHQAMK